MKKQQINLVWIKRDIRSQDHLPFDMAEKSEYPYLSIFVFEPSIMAYPDTSVRHLQFQYHSLLQLNQKFEQSNKAVHIFHTDIIHVLAIIQQQYEIVNLYSYQESGIQLTYERDKLVQKYCNANTNAMTVTTIKNTLRFPPKNAALKNNTNTLTKTAAIPMVSANNKLASMANNNKHQLLLP